MVLLYKLFLSKLMIYYNILVLFDIFRIFQNFFSKVNIRCIT